MKPLLFPTFTLAAAFLPATLSAAEDAPWTFDLTLYGLAAGMTGDVIVKGVPADVDVGFDKIWDNLEMGVMGKVRVGRGRWAFNADVIYMGLGAAKNNVSADVDQWVVEPSLSYRIADNFEVLAGVRYNHLGITIDGPFGLTPSGTEEWWDPIVGANFALPFAEKFSFNVRGDVGGFGIGSDLTWQAFPFLGWQISDACSVQAGYRLVYTDYDTGSGANRFKYDMLTHGPQVGLTIRF